jgi:predicted metalloenzyme YecM
MNEYQFQEILTKLNQAIYEISQLSQKFAYINFDEMKQKIDHINSKISQMK